MAPLNDIIASLDQRTRRREIADFPGAENGLQLANTSGEVRKIGAAVDAGLEPFRRAAAAGVDLLVVHHGMFWSPLQPLTGHRFEKVRLAIESNLAVYSSHLPLDAHPEIGNNASLARLLGLEVVDWFVEHEGTPIAAIAQGPGHRTELAKRLREAFPGTFTAIEYGSGRPERVAILTGSGRAAIKEMPARGIDTLVTGELRQEHYNLAQEQRLNLYPCGHYATETFGVTNLARETAGKFELDYQFIPTDCPL